MQVSCTYRKFQFIKELSGCSRYWANAFIKEQAQSVYAERLTDEGYVTLAFDSSYFGKSEGLPRQQELPDVQESDIEGTVNFLSSLPFVDSERIGGLGICGSGSYMSVTAIVPAISDISKSAMAGFFKPEDEVKAAKEAYEAGHYDLYDLAHMYLRRLISSHHSSKRILASKKGRKDAVSSLFLSACRNDIQTVSQ